MSGVKDEKQIMSLVSTMSNRSSLMRLKFVSIVGGKDESNYTYRTHD
jgi:hypothetical protein